MNDGFYDFGDKAAAVRSLQKKIRTLSLYDESVPRICVDGIYGEETAEAVGALQKAAGMRATGFPDFGTFMMIEERYAGEMGKRPENGAGYLPPFERMHGQAINYGDETDDVRVLQCLLNAASEEDERFAVEVDGVFGEETLRAVNLFRSVLGMPKTDRVSFETWNALVRFLS